MTYRTYRTVVLCGSTRFYEEFQRANFEETMKGHIVLSVGFYPGAKWEQGESVGITPEQKRMLDEMYREKIRRADEVLVLNKNGYIGLSTLAEILYAMSLEKPIRYLEPDRAPDTIIHGDINPKGEIEVGISWKELYE